MNQECARIARALKSEREEASFSHEAADFLFKSGQEDAAMEAYRQCAEAYKRLGSFESAAAVLRKVGEYQEAQLEPELAAEYFTKAAELFSLAKYKVVETTKLRLKVADLYSEMRGNPERLGAAIKVR